MSSAENGLHVIAFFFEMTGTVESILESIFITCWSGDPSESREKGHLHSKVIKSFGMQDIQKPLQTPFNGMSSLNQKSTRKTTNSKKMHFESHVNKYKYNVGKNRVNLF